jgi:hypothetical protein
MVSRSTTVVSMTGPIDSGRDESARLAIAELTGVGVDAGVDLVVDEDEDEDEDPTARLAAATSKPDGGTVARAADG